MVDSLGTNSVQYYRLLCMDSNTMRTPERLVEICESMNPSRFPQWMIETAHEIAVHLRDYTRQQGNTFSLIDDITERNKVLMERNARQAERIEALIKDNNQKDEILKIQDELVNRRIRIINHLDEEKTKLNDTIRSLQNACKINQGTISDLIADARHREQERNDRR